MPDSAIPPAIPAATIVLVRDRAGAPPDLLMIERSAEMVFAAGALVFPGGRIDPQDHTLAADRGRLLTGRDLASDEAAARVAAIRETIEEVGLPVGVAGDIDLPHFRAGLAAGEPFPDLLAAAGALLDLDILTPFARWRPAMKERRNFDTRFYLARAPEDADEVVIDGGENVHALWIGAADALAEADAGRRHVIFPTRRNLERLARFASLDDACRDARSREIRMITPFAQQREGATWLCIPDDQGYPVTGEPIERVVRG